MCQKMAAVTTICVTHGQKAQRRALCSWHTECNYYLQQGGHTDEKTRMRMLRLRVPRVNMEDVSGTLFCERCEDAAAESGLFTEGERLAIPCPKQEGRA